MLNTFNREKEKKDLLNFKKWGIVAGKKRKQNNPTGNSRTESYN